MPVDYPRLQKSLRIELQTHDFDVSKNPHGLTVGFTGGRDDADIGLFNFVMQELSGWVPIRKVIHGDARGYDTLGKLWGMRTRKIVQSLPARWKSQGNAAGPRRNDLMIEALLKEPMPFVMGFPGGSGTADMLMKVDMAGIAYIAIGDLLD